VIRESYAQAPLALLLADSAADVLSVRATFCQVVHESSEAARLQTRPAFSNAFVTEFNALVRLWLTRPFQIMALEIETQKEPMKLKPRKI
jgi:hypothetical protein